MKRPTGTTMSGNRADAIISGAAPRLPRMYVPRQRLFETLDHATGDTGAAVTLLVAPAGAGKTLGVSGWLRQRDRADDAVWVHADPTWDAARLAEVLGDGSRLVVIDDAHTLPSAALRLVDHRLTDAPETLRLLLLSRWDLPLTRLVPELLGHLTILRGDVLRMDDEEAAALIVEHSRSSSPEVVEAISEHAQGWCAAIVLTSRAVGAAPDPVAAANRYRHEETHIADRVATEVFAALHPRERHLLLCIAAEEVVSVPTAVLLTHDPVAGDVLADLEFTGLLVTRVGHDADAHYRIHPLLAEVVRRRLAVGGVDVMRARSTVSRAVHLDLARGDAERAFDRLVAVGESDLAADVLAAEGLRMVLGGQGPAIAAFVRRHADVVEQHPQTWFAVAFERWVVDDVETARHWMDRILVEAAQSAGRAAVATVRLMRSRLGLEPMDAAAEHAEETVQALVGHALAAGADQMILPLLTTELGISQNWLGHLADAEANLTASVGVARSRGLLALAASATAHLAFTEYMSGRERACSTLANEAVGLLRSGLPWRPEFVAHSAALALLLSGLVDVPSQTEPIEPPAVPTPVHSADLCTRFWLRMRDARLALLSGSVAGAERVLTTPLDVPVAGPLPDHLRVVVLVERAFLAALSSDQLTIRGLEHELHLLGVKAETALVAGLRADLAGDRRAAATLFGTAAAETSYHQPDTRALALGCQAQLLDILGEPESALAALRDAAGATEVRRNAVPFLGWSRQGTPMSTLLHRLSKNDEGHLGSWADELARAANGRPDVAALFAPTTATVRERTVGPRQVVAPTLSPREREVLNELARGATYADIAAHLFVSENTVKTHVSSLYGKLAASRRSEALAVARRLNLV